MSFFLGGGGDFRGTMAETFPTRGKKKAFQLGVDFLGAAHPPVSVSSDQHLPEFPSFFFEWKQKWESNSWNVLVGPVVNNSAATSPDRRSTRGESTSVERSYLHSCVCYRETQMDGVTIR